MSVVDRIAARVLAWRDRRAEPIPASQSLDDAITLGEIAGRMLRDYQAAVAGGASPETLGEILTGIAGCELAASRCYVAAGWDPDREPGRLSHGWETRLAGLLMQEVGYCAAEGIGYRGVRAREFERAPIAEALRNLALAYAKWAPLPTADLRPAEQPVPVERRLDELVNAGLPIMGGPPVELVAALANAHQRGSIAAGVA